MRFAALLGVLGLVGCQDYALREPPPVPVAEPPGAPDSEFGSPPNWQNCFGGFLGTYANLTVEHPDMEPDELTPPPDDPFALDWWDEMAFEQYDPHLDFGANWWPVDQGLAGDPAHFAARWRAWIRAWSGGQIRLLVGASDDVWVFINGEAVIAEPGPAEYSPQTYSFHLPAGQYPLEIRYAHRTGPSGFRFRLTGGDATICYPSF